MSRSCENLKIVSYLGLKSRGIKKANPDLLSAHNPPSFDILLNGKYLLWKKYLLWAVVMAELVKRLLPIPEVCCSNPVIANFCFEHLFTVNWIEKTKIKKKRPGMPIFKKYLLVCGTGGFCLKWHVGSTSTIFIFELSQDQK